MAKSSKNASGKGKANVKAQHSKVSSNKINPENDFDLDLEGLKLEEDVEAGNEEAGMTNLDLKNLEFSNFMSMPEQAEVDRGSVALERMALSAPRPIFVGGMPQGTASSENGGENDPFKYMPGNGSGDEPKYSVSADSAVSRAERVEPGRRIEEFLPTNPELLLSRVTDPRISASSMESVERARRFDAEKEIRMNFAEREEARYKEYKPKVPKG